MFVVDCPGHGTRTILSTASVTAVDQRDGVIDVHLRCWCGHALVHRTGRCARRRSSGVDLAV
jgi:hypothetical protein